MPKATVYLFQIFSVHQLNVEKKQHGTDSVMFEILKLKKISKLKISFESKYNCVSLKLVAFGNHLAS